MCIGQLLVYLNKHDEAINVVSNYLSVLSDSDSPNIAKMVESIYNLGAYVYTVLLYDISYNFGKNVLQSICLSYLILYT